MSRWEEIKKKVREPKKCKECGWEGPDTELVLEYTGVNADQDDLYGWNCPNCGEEIYLGY
jgi:predicted RNA-binding Zn-ribbon protein involved in translation (DUF1610 family)